MCGSGALTTTTRSPTIQHPCTTLQGPLSARKKPSGAGVISATQAAGQGVTIQLCGRSIKAATWDSGICRSSGQKFAHDYDNPEWFEPYNRRPAGYETATGSLKPLLLPPGSERITTVEDWEKHRGQVLAKWEKHPGNAAWLQKLEGPPQVDLIREFEMDSYTGRLMYIQVEPDYWEKIYLMLPPPGFEQTCPRGDSPLL